MIGSDAPATQTQPVQAAAIVIDWRWAPTREQHVQLVPIQAIDFYSQPKESAPCSS